MEYSEVDELCFAREGSLLLYSNGAGGSIFELTVPLVPLKRRGILFLHVWVSWLVCWSVELSNQSLTIAFF